MKQKAKSNHKLYLFWLGALKYAQKNRLNNDLDFAEDFASFCVLRALSSDAKLYYNWLFIDFLRQEFAKTDNGKANLYLNERLGAIPIEEEFNEEYATYQAQAPEQIDYNFVINFVDKYKLKSDDRAIFLLRFHYEFELNEIGLLYGFSESRASQRINEICSLIRIKHRKMMDKKSSCS